MTHHLRVLLLADFTAAPCGIRNFADMTYEGLRRHPDLTVDRWDAHYPAVYARREACQPTYLPDNAQDYDVIHLNWHPIALNTYGPGHFPWPKGTGPLVSVYLNDVPPWSGCPVAERADVLVSPEDYSGEHGQRPPDHLMVYPIPDWVENLPPPLNACQLVPRFTVGWSGVRGDGHEALEAVCDAHGWAKNRRLPGEPWTTVDEEIRRLARSTVNVCWYHQQRGIAGTPSIMLGSRRPLVLNNSAMFTPWWHPDYSRGGGPRELYYGADQMPGGSLEDTLRIVYEDWKRGGLQLPGPRVYADHGWVPAAARLVAHWHSVLEAR